MSVTAREMITRLNLFIFVKEYILISFFQIFSLRDVVKKKHGLWEIVIQFVLQLLVLL